MYKAYLPLHILMAKVLNFSVLNRSYWFIFWNSRNLAERTCHIGEKPQQSCKYFSQVCLLFNNLVINVLQNLLFCIPKAALLHGKSVCFALQKSRFRNIKAQLSLFNGIIFTKPC